jgi:hypothetical protein
VFASAEDGQRVCFLRIHWAAARVYATFERLLAHPLDSEHMVFYQLPSRTDFVLLDEEAS